MICDAIQQMVHKVGKLVFPGAMEIGRENRKEHLKKKKNQVNLCLWSQVMICDSEIPSFEKMSWKVVAAKNFAKN